MRWVTYSYSYKIHCEIWFLALPLSFTSYSPKWESSLLTSDSLSSKGAFDMCDFLNWLLQLKAYCINWGFLIHLLNDFFRDCDRFVTKVELTFPDYITFIAVWTYSTLVVAILL